MHYSIYSNASTMLQRALALILAGLMTWMAQPALAQGLRPSPPLGAGTGLLRVPAPQRRATAPRGC